MRVLARSPAGLALAVCLLAALSLPATAEPVPPNGAAPHNPSTPKPIPQKPEPSPAPKAKPEVPPAQQGTSAVVMDLSAIDSVIGKPVKSEGGEDLGRIVDLLVTTSGQVRAAVLDFGGVLGVGTRKIAVDWKALEFANVAKDGVVRLALTRNQVRVAPEYKAGDPVVIIEATKAEDAKASVPSKGAAAPTPAPPAPVSTPQGGASTK